MKKKIRTELFEPDFVKFGDGINEPCAWAAAAAWLGLVFWAVFWSKRQAELPCFAYRALALLLLPTCNCCEEDERLLELLITLLLQMFIADPELLFGVKLELRRPKLFKLVVDDRLLGEESVLKSEWKQKLAGFCTLFSTWVKILI